MTLDATLSPSPVVQFWNDTLAPKFLRYQHILVGGLSRHTAAVMPTLPVPRGGRIADIGCGFGDTAIELARLAGPQGHVVGMDCCADFLAVAREEQAAAGIGNLEFVVADAERDLPRGAYDFVFSRFGTMFFTSPVAGLRTMARALRPGGRMTHVVWAAREDNPWLTAARDVLLAHVEGFNAGGPTCGPGPFSMADPDLLRSQMAAAGFEDIIFQRVDAQVMVGENLEEAVAFQLAIGPAGEVFRMAGQTAEARRGQIDEDLRSLFRRQSRDHAGIWMDSSSWVVHARVREA